MKKKLAVYGFIGLLASSAFITVAIARPLKAPSQNPIQSTEVSSNPHDGHSTNDMNMPEMSDNRHHEGNEIKSEKGENFQAKLSVSEAITANRPVTLLIDIQDSKGKAVSKFATFQEKLIHLIVVSDDLLGNKVQFMTSFPQPEKYKLWGQFNRNGKIIVADFWVNVAPN